MKRVHLAVSLVLLFAASLGAGAEAAGLFDTLRNAITAPDAGFLANSLALGNDIFVTIFVTYVIAGLCICTFTNNFDTFWWDLGQLVVKMIPPLAALNFAHLILPDMVGFVTYFTGRITGYGDGAGGADALVGLGLNTALALIHSATAPISTPGGIAGALANPGNLPLTLVNIVFAWLAAIVIYFAFVWVAIEIVLAWYQVLFASAVGAASVGFFGAGATSDMAFRYTSGVVAGVWKVILLTVWPYTVSAVFLGFHFVAALTDPTKFLMAIVEITVFAFVVITATRRIVHIADMMFSGHASFTLGDVGRTVTNAVTVGLKAAKAGARA